MRFSNFVCSAIFAGVLVVPIACHADSITGVVFTGSPANPTITIYGSGFGTEPAPSFLAYPGFTGYDYGSNLYIEDFSPTHGFSAGLDAGYSSRDTIGLVVTTYTDSEISYQLGSDYSEYYFPVGIYALAQGDEFEVVTDATYKGTVTYTTSAVPEPSGLILLGTGVLGLAGSLRRRFLE